MVGGINRCADIGQVGFFLNFCQFVQQGATAYHASLVVESVVVDALVVFAVLVDIDNDVELVVIDRGDQLASLRVTFVPKAAVDKNRPFDVEVPGGSQEL